MCRESLLRCASTNSLITLHAHCHVHLHPQELSPKGDGLYVIIVHQSNEDYSQVLRDAPAKRGKGLIDGAGLFESIPGCKAGLVPLTACALGLSSRLLFYGLCLQYYYGLDPMTPSIAAASCSCRLRVLSQAWQGRADAVASAQNAPSDSRTNQRAATGWSYLQGLQG